MMMMVVMMMMIVMTDDDDSDEVMMSITVASPWLENSKWWRAGIEKQLPLIS